MNITLRAVAYLLLCMSMLCAQPTELRTWTSLDDSTFEAKATQLKSGKVTLVGKNGRKLTVPVAKLSEADRAFLRKHFAVSGPAAKTPKGLGIELGKISERTKADSDSFYRIYLPTTMDSVAPPPVFFFSAYGGYKEGLVERFYTAAEITGVVIAISAEKQNPGADFFPQSEANIKDCLKDIYRTYPVDKKRVILSGTSGDGSAAIYTAARLRSCVGVIPFVCYMPRDTRINRKAFYYVGGGATDYNRYHSAEIGVMAKERGIHRIWTGDHASARPREAFEAFIWLYTRHIYEDPDARKREIQLFEPRFLAWLEKEKTKRPWTVYFWTDHLLRICKISGGFTESIKALQAETAKHAMSRKYLECFDAMLAFSEEVYAPQKRRTSNYRQHTSPEIEAAAKALDEKYGDVPELGPVIKELPNKTL